MKEGGKIRAIIVEYDENDLLILEKYLADIPEVELVGTATRSDFLTSRTLICRQFKN